VQDDAAFLALALLRLVVGIASARSSRTYDDGASGAGQLRTRSNRGKVSGSRQSALGRRLVDGRGSSARCSWAELATAVKEAAQKAAAKERDRIKATAVKSVP